MFSFQSIISNISKLTYLSLLVTLLACGGGGAGDPSFNSFGSQKTLSFEVALPEALQNQEIAGLDISVALNEDDVLADAYVATKQVEQIAKFSDEEISWRQENNSLVITLPDTFDQEVEESQVFIAIEVHGLKGETLGRIEMDLAGNEYPRIYLCHYPPENPDNLHTILVSVNAVLGHLSHGDTVGACPEDPTPESICSDGVLDAGEECDDGNLENGDGCSSNCQVEEDNPANHAGFIEFESNDYVITVPDYIREVTFYVYRSGGYSGAVSVDLSVSDISGTLSDSITPSRLTWADGEYAPKAFTVTVVADGLQEQAGVFSVDLANPTGGAQLGAFSQARFTISWQIFCNDGIVDTRFGEECEDGNFENGDGCDMHCHIE